MSVGEQQREEHSPPTHLPEKKGEEAKPLAASPEASQEAPAPPEGKANSPLPGVGSSKRRWKLALVFAVAAVAFGIWYFAIRTPEPRDDFGRLQGEWWLAVPTGGGEKQAKTQSARLVQGVTMRFAGDRVAWRVGDKEQKTYVMVIRPEANPKEIDLTQLAPDDKPVMQGIPPQPVVIRGIYSVERDWAKIVAAIGAEPRPTDLNATDGVTVWILERVK